MSHYNKNIKFEEENNMLKIVLSGGPCSGKSVGKNILTQLLEARGYHVFTVFEAATSLIVNGIHPSSNISMDDFQEFIIDMQLSTEKIFEDVIKYHNPDKVIIFYDRSGILNLPMGIRVRTVSVCSVRVSKFRKDAETMPI